MDQKTRSHSLAALGVAATLLSSCGAFKSDTAPSHSGERTRTVYEDAEDGLTLGWVTHGDGTFSNVAGGANGSTRAIELTLGTEDNAFFLGKEDGSEWNNTREFSLEIAVNVAEPAAAAFTLKVRTNDRIKYIRYVDGATPEPADPDIVTIGLGDIANGNWHAIVRDVQNDLRVLLPNVELHSIDGLFVHGSARIDNVALATQPLPRYDISSCEATTLPDKPVLPSIRPFTPTPPL